MSKSLKYKGVYFIDKNNGKPCNKWRAAFKPANGDAWHKTFDTEHEAAKAYDIRLISLGLPPVNVLKPK